MRNPSIHIKRSDLSNILLKYDIRGIAVDNIMKEAFQYSIKNRISVRLPRKSVKKLEKVINIDKKVVDAFNGVFIPTLLNNGIKMLSINPGDKRYLVFMDIAKQAVEFCELFGLEYKEGFRIYVEIGINLLKSKFHINTLKGTADRIVAAYKDIQVIETDETPEQTQLMYRIWQDIMWRQFKRKPDIQDDSNKYVYFVYAKRDADAAGAKYVDWLEAQFDKWKWKNEMPFFSQLCGDNAKLNYQIYMGKDHVISTGEEKYVESDLEKKYFKALEEGKFKRKTNLK